MIWAPGTVQTFTISNFKYCLLYSFSPALTLHLQLRVCVGEGWEGVQLLFKVEKSKLHNTSHEGRGEQQWPKSRQRQRNDRQNQHAVAAPCSSLCTHAVVCVCVCGSLGGWLSRSSLAQLLSLSG